VEAQRAPLVGAQRLAGAGLGQQRGHAASARQALLEQFHDLGRVHLAGQTRLLLAGGVEQDQGGVGAHLEALGQALGAGQITVQIDRDHGPGLGDEVLALEEGGLELVAGRAPGGAPVEQHGLALLTRLGQGALDHQRQPRRHGHCRRPWCPPLAPVLQELEHSTRRAAGLYAQIRSFSS
jgi:hypothetical protein